MTIVHVISANHVDYTVVHVTLAAYMFHIVLHVIYTTAHVTPSDLIAHTAVQVKLVARATLRDHSMIHTDHASQADHVNLEYYVSQAGHVIQEDHVNQEDHADHVDCIVLHAATHLKTTDHTENTTHNTADRITEIAGHTTRTIITSSITSSMQCVFQKLPLYQH